MRTLSMASAKNFAKGLAAAALVASAAVAGASPAAAAAGSCAATYQITGGWTGPGTTGFSAVVTVRNSGTVPITGWAVAWIYRDRQSVTAVYNAVPLPTIAIVGAYAFGNTPANGNLSPGQITQFYLYGQAAGTPTAPSPISCTPR